IAANIIARRSLADVSVQLRFPDHIFAGKAANLTVTIVNHKRFLPTYSLSVEAVSGPSELHEIDENENSSSANSGKDHRRSGKAGTRELRSGGAEMEHLAYFALETAC